jgi:iron complex transport system substrate-binding protein
LRPLTAVLAACVLFAGCERKQEPADDIAAIRVTDDAGRAVTLPRAATRVVSLMPTVTDLIIAMGQADRLIARTDYDLDTTIANLPSLGGGLTPSVEWLAAQKPELVIAWPDHGTRSLVGKMEAVGLRVYAARTDTLANTFSTIRNLGVLLGSKAAADSLAASITAGLDSVRAAIQGREPVRVAYLVSVAPPTVVGPRTFINELITIAGGINVFADIGQLYPEINIEELVRRDPDVIVIARESEADLRAELAALPVWREMRAVKAGRVHRVSPYDFNRSGPLMPRAARVLASFFHPAQ